MKKRRENHKELVIAELWRKFIRTLSRWDRLGDAGWEMYVGRKGKKRLSCDSRIIKNME